VNTGGLQSSFGLRHSYIPEALHIARKYNCSITTLHTHIGSGTDPETWLEVAKLSLLLLEQLPDVDTLDLGG
jgi:diaminopimelate decarboxylase